MVKREKNWINFPLIDSSGFHVSWTMNYRLPQTLNVSWKWIQFLDSKIFTGERELRILILNINIEQTPLKSLQHFKKFQRKIYPVPLKREWKIHETIYSAAIKVFVWWTTWNYFNIRSSPKEKKKSRRKPIHILIEDSFERKFAFSWVESLFKL